MTPPHYAVDTVTLHHGDCLDVLRALPDNSIDSVVTDPPYGLEFMGKEWDSFKGDAWRNSAGITGTGYTDGGNRLARPSYGGSDSANPTCATCGGRKRGARKCICAEPEWRVKGKPLGARDNNAAQMRAFGAWCELWATECLRVLKPGGHILAFGGTRTWHRLAVAVEDAGFEIRDSIAWIYGSGFPKSRDVGKAIDKAASAEREVTGNTSTTSGRTLGVGTSDGFHGGIVSGHCRDITAPATDLAQQWDGWGTALKPAFEPVVVGRKPLVGTVAANVTVWGTGALNINACRIGEQERTYSTDSGMNAQRFKHDARPADYGRGRGETATVSGRWPANVVLDEGQAATLDQQSGERVSGGSPNRSAARGVTQGASNGGTQGGYNLAGMERQVFNDKGGASRFFLTVPPVDELDARFLYQAKAPKSERPVVDGVSHATVKPLALMRWLVRLVTQPGGVVLEPFAGSGTTVEACILEGFRCVAIERGVEYLPLILARIERAHATVEASAATAGDLLDLDFGT